MKKTAIYGIALMLTALAGCTENLTDSTAEEPGQGLEFMPEISNDLAVTRALAAQETYTVTPLTADDGETLYMHSTTEPRVSATTRGTLINDVTNDLTALGNFGVSGYRYAPATQTVNSVTANFFFNAEVKENAGTWRSSTPYYIPAAADRLAFYAYSPYSASFASTEVTALTGNGTTSADYGPMVLTYTVNPTLEQQADLMVANNETTFNTNKKVALDFHHALTALKFVLGKDVSPSWSIEWLKIGSVINTAKYKVGTGWVYDSSTTRSSFTLDFTSAQKPNGKALSDTDKQLMDGDEYYLMIPQTFTDDDDDQCLTIMLKNPTTGKEKELTFPLKGTTWTAGTIITYAITTSSVNVVQAGITYPADWGGEAFTLKDSYDDGASIGVYAVDINTKKVISKNMQLTYNEAAGTWATTGDDVLKYNSNYDYYFYYPYKRNITDGLGDTFSGSGASAFFSGVISSWTVTDDQSDADKLLANDLQIGQAVHDTNNFCHVSVAMQHALGLAKITLETKDVTPRINLTSGNPSVYSGSYRIDLADKLIYRASNQDIKDYMCPNSDASIYYYIVKGTQNKTFSSSSTGDNAWKSSLTGTLVNGECYTALAELKSVPALVEYDGWYWDYTDNAQSFTVTETGTYMIECWGASGGDGTYANETSYVGRGGYTKGEMLLSNGETLYIYVGGMGDARTDGEFRSIIANTGGYNGGGNTSNCGNGGGGATDIRLSSTGTWSDFSSLKSRIMVAAGGGGMNYYPNHSDGGNAGGLIGCRFDARDTSEEYNYGGTQTSGGTSNPSGDGLKGNDGSFGQGGDGYFGAGGGGYYGGSGGSNQPYKHADAGKYAEIGGGGGSSFISGHNGCNAIAESSTSSNIVHTGQPNHYSGKVFTNTRMIDGAGYEWTTVAGTTVIGVPQTLAGGYETAGHTGNGFVRITNLTPIN